MMNINRRSFLKRTITIGAGLAIPSGFIIKGIEHLGYNRKGLYEEFGIFLKKVSDYANGCSVVGIDALMDGYLMFPRNITRIFERVSIRTGLIDRLRKQALIGLFYLTEESMLVDTTSIGEIACDMICKELEFKAKDYGLSKTNIASRLKMKARYIPAESRFLIVMRAL